MTTEIKAGEPVLALTLPIPVEGMTYINDFIDRVYGTGNTTMQGQGNQVVIAAPKEGFGPVLRDPMPQLTRDADGELFVSALDTTTEPIVWDLESVTGPLGLVVQSQLAFLDLVEARNYVATQLRVGDEVVQVTVQRDGHPSPHDLRLEAEEREAALRAALTDVRDALRSGDIARASEVIGATL
ncbi:hypothetical protein ACWGJ9_08545 [Curtobacterium citreum]